VGGGVVGTKEYQPNPLTFVWHRSYWNNYNIKILKHIKLISINYSVVMLKLGDCQPFVVVYILY